MGDRGRSGGSSSARNSGSAPNSSGRPSGGSSSMSRIKSDRNERSDRKSTPSSERPHHRSSGDQNSSSGGGQQRDRGHGGGGGGRAMSMLSGQAFTDNELMSDLPKKKFTGRCRLFVGNLPNDLKEDELKELFAPHGDIAECYLSGKGFAFLRMDTRAHAESAKEAIDGKMIHNRPVRVRFAVHGAALKVKELSPTVSNEMLYHAFSAFGEVERAVHIVDEKGRPTGEGIVEFERKPSANEALHQIRDKVFLLTSSPKPLVVEMLEPRDEDDGLAERMIPRNAQLQKERELGPRFPPSNSFEFVFGQKWKELYEVERQRRAQLEEELKEARRRLDADMELAYQDYQTQMLREDLARRQQELERLEEAKRQRMAQVAARRGEIPTSILSGVGSAPPQSVGAPPPGVTSGGPPRGEFFGAGGTTTGGAPPPQRGPFGGPGGPGPDMMRGPAPDVLGRAPPDMMGRGGPPMDGPMGRNMGPPFQQGPPGSGGQRGPSGPGGPGMPDPTLVQGVQKLLQIFRTDTSAGGAPRPMQPPQGFGGPGYGGPGGPGGPGPMGPGGPPFGGGPGGPPGGFHRGPPVSDFQPSEKRIRR
ncbi:Paraspeckle component 1 [Toxocara canis]|uniref:Paraspeckle component 1 n=1 Tax=Toxocara canis TaxID=6265 RepID=A0A0B2V6E8_TOXCA|nr:Paraspeckle component 1 [Toxocara canis]